MGFGQAGTKRCGECVTAINWGWRGKSQKGDSCHKEGSFSLWILLYCETLVQVLLDIYCKRFYHCSLYYYFIHFIILLTILSLCLLSLIYFITILFTISTILFNISLYHYWLYYYSLYDCFTTLHNITVDLLVWV